MSEESLDITIEEFERVCRERLRPRAGKVWYGVKPPERGAADGDIWWSPGETMERAALGPVRRREGGSWVVLPQETLERIQAIALAERVRERHKGEIVRLESGEWSCARCGWAAENPIGLLKVECERGE